MSFLLYVFKLKRAGSIFFEFDYFVSASCYYSLYFVPFWQKFYRHFAGWHSAKAMNPPLYTRSWPWEQNKSCEIVCLPYNDVITHAPTSPLPPPPVGFPTRRVACGPLLLPWIVPDFCNFSIVLCRWHARVVRNHYSLDRAPFARSSPDMLRKIWFKKCREMLLLHVENTKKSPQATPFPRSGVSCHRIQDSENLTPSWSLTLASLSPTPVTLTVARGGWGGGGGEACHAHDPCLYFDFAIWGLFYHVYLSCFLYIIRVIKTCKKGFLFVFHHPARPPAHRVRH